MSIIRAMCTTVFTLASVHMGSAQEWPDAPNASFATVGEVTRLLMAGWISAAVNCKNAINPYSRRLTPMLTPQAWKTLNEINQQVNAAITPVSNLEHWGTIADHWDYPYDGKGDRKIYALQKRKLLRRKASRARPS